MTWARMNLKSLLIIWISYDREMSGEDTRQERGIIKKGCVGEFGSLAKCVSYTMLQENH